MKTTILILFQLFSLVAWSQTPGIVGKWRTIDDETRKPKSIIEVRQEGDLFTGQVAELLNPAEPDPVCEKCSGEKKNQPVKGMQIMWGFKEAKKGEEWSDGHILDPNNGKTYSGRLRLKDNGEKLEVRGFIGISLLGRSQTWIREK